ncbi:TonB-dependent receptor [Altererythrobacter sp. GH1-8]|uniref:TonB-dependent receptor n=1 Tax=Altererythrobacter sp. GH1-8 TaxID=3349333 RepID=UPI00374CD577
MNLRVAKSVLACALVSASTLAIAQDDAAGGVTADDETAAGNVILVTAQRREESLQETPVAVSALTADKLEQLAITEVGDLGRAVPNLQVLPVTANPSALQIGLRGGAEQAGGLIVSEPVVGIYVDDVYRARLQGANAQLGDIERVEVLRGPQGTLYGRNNFSGAFKLITKTPSPSNEWINASLSYGTFDTIIAQSSIGQGLSDTLGASVSVLYRDQGDGWIYNRAQDRDVGQEENLVVRGKLALDTGPLRAALSVSYGKDTNDGYISAAGSFPRVPTGRSDFVSADEATPRFGNDPYVTEFPQDSFGYTETTAISLNAEYDVSDSVTLRSITGYVDLNDGWRWDLVGGFEASPGVYSPGFDRTSIANANQFTQELQALGSTDGGLEWILGAFYFRESADQSLTDNIPIFFLFNLDPTTLDIKTDSWAIFGQATYELTDTLALTAGARYTEDDKSFDAEIQSGFGMPNPRTAVALDRKFSAFTPKIGLEAKLSDNAFAYASISKGFKAGGFNGLSVLNPLVLSSVYDEQTVWAYEGGLKLQSSDRRLTANTSVYYNDISGLQQTALVGPGSFAQQNVGSASVFGVEIEFAAEPIDGLNLFANIGYQDDDIKSLDPSSQAFVAGAKNLPLVSDWTLQGGFSYETPLGNTGYLSFGADARYVGDYWVEVTNSYFVDGYTRVNGFVSLETSDRRWKLSLQGQNLTDEVNYVSGAAGLPFPSLTILRPRTLQVSIGYSFD